MSRAMNRMVMAAAVVCVTAVGSFAQQTTTATAEKTFEVLAVDGSRLVVNLPEGTRELTVPDDFRFTVNGQPLSMRELKVGMKGTATITTRTTVTPVTVTEIKNGEVIQAAAGTIVLRTDTDIKRFSQSDVDKRGVTIMREGRPAQVSDFRTGDRLTATIITTKPPQIMTEREVQATLAPAAERAAPPPAAVPQAAVPPAPSAPPAQARAEAPAPAAPRALPKTASSWPLVALASVLSLALGLGLTARRRVVRGGGL